MNRQYRRKTGTGSTVPARSTPADAAFATALALHKAGHLGRAEPLYRRALKLDPDHGDSLNFLGMLCLQSGRAEEAAQLLHRALAHAPDSPAVHYNLAGAKQAFGRHGEAAAHYRRVVEIQPAHQGARNNLGLALQALGRHAEAAEALGAALALGSDPRIHCNLGALRLEMGETRQAMLHFRQAMRGAASHPEAAVGLARALLDGGDPAAALAQACAALTAGETAQARTIFVAAIATAPPSRIGETGRHFLERALREQWGAVHDLARAAAALVAARHAGGASPQALAADPLLAALLDAAPVVNRELEAALTLARQALLQAANAGDGAADLLAFWCALAQQCALNEYVFATTAAECGAVAALSARLCARLAEGGPLPPLWPVALAAYGPLVALPDPALLLRPSWPPPVATLLRRQIEERLAERAAQAAIPALTPVCGAVSAAVRAQYEENPYPRWTGRAPGEPAIGLEAYLARRLPGQSFDLPPSNGGHDVLIAGCGTGQQSIAVARSLCGARVLAVDLSLASLAYARRQTEALGVAGIDYAQADLLQLGETLGAAGRRFDMIQASGVLHHLADPMEGWQALLALLRPGGAMFVGLYSRAARRDVATARAFIATHGLAPTPDGIRRCRQDMMAAPEGTPLRRLSHSSDFGSMSGCRDLLFHVQEHQLSLPQIAAFLDAQDRTFLGFDLPPAVTNAYRAEHPDAALTDLARWDRFEAAHPDVFAGMYQFWIRALLLGLTVLDLAADLA